MPKKFEKYWYQKNAAVKSAFLFHCRDRDLRSGSGILKGTILQGAVGFVVAEADVPELTGNIISSFQPNRRCLWRGFELQCMADPRAPVGNHDKKVLRPYNYIVAEVIEEDAVSEANKLGVPIIIHGSGKQLLNLECSTFEAQGKNSPKRASLL